MPEVAQRLTGRMFKAALTQRETEVLHLLARGLRNKEIAAELRISEETVQGHVKSILAKLSVHDRTEAAAIAIKGKLKKSDFDATVALHPTMAEELVLMR